MQHSAKGEPSVFFSLHHLTPGGGEASQGTTGLPGTIDIYQNNSRHGHWCFEHVLNHIFRFWVFFLHFIMTNSYIFFIIYYLFLLGVWMRSSRKAYRSKLNLKKCPTMTHENVAANTNFQNVYLYILHYNPNLDWGMFSSFWSNSPGQRSVITT